MVLDNDQDTYITTETSLGSDDDTFKFYTADKNVLTITEDTFNIYNDNVIITNDNGNITTKGHIECEKNIQVFGDIDLSKNLIIGDNILSLTQVEEYFKILKQII